MVNSSSDLLLRLCKQAGDGAESCPDHQLLARFVGQGDEAAFAALLERHGPMVLAVCRRTLPDEHLVEDVLQATFLVLVRNASAIRNRPSVGSWVHGVALRLSRKAKADAVRAGRGDTRSNHGSPPDPVAEVSWREVRQIIDEELQRLPECYRLPLVLCCLEGRTRDEAAAHLGWSLGRLKGRLERGRERLRSRLIRRGVAPAAAGSALLAETAFAESVSPLLAVATLRAASRLATGAELGTCGASQTAVSLTGGFGVMRSKKLTLVLMLALGLGALGAGIGLGMGGNADDQRPNEAPPAHLFAPNRGTPDEAKNGGPPTNDRPRAKTVPPEKNATVPAPLKENTMGLGATVVPEKKEIMLGEPVFMAFKVANPTETPWQFAVGGDYRNRLGRPESFKVEVIGPDGKSVPQPDAGPSLGGIGGFARLPVNGEHSFELFLPHWATFEKPGEYKITVQRKVGLIAADAEEPFKAKPTVVTLSATATILVTEKDSKRLGALIEDLGKTMLDPKSVDSDRATRKLLEIRDPRVIPHFIAFSKLPHHAPRLVACKALGRFKTDEAFAALKALAATTGSDLRGTATRPDLEESSADSVRYAAVGALAGCGHPDSLPLVWKAIDDSYWGVRLAVLHKAAEVKSPEARAIIETLTKDPNETVRKEAIRYKELLAKEKK